MILPRIRHFLSTEAWWTLGLSLLVAILVSFTGYFGSEGLDVRIKVKGNGDNLENALITITDSTGEEIIDTLRTNARGQFTYTLPYDNVYRIYFDAEGYKTIFARFETNIPENQKYSLQFFPSTVDLFPKEADDLNRKVIAQRPFMIVSYNPAYGIFEGEQQSLLEFIKEIDRPLIGNLYIKTYIPDTLMKASENAPLFVYNSEGKRIDSAKIVKNDSTEFVLPLQNEYKLAVESPDHLNTFAELDATVPEDVQDKDYNLTLPLLPVPRTDSLDEIKKMAVRSPAQLVLYDTTQGQFGEDLTHRYQFKDQLEGKNISKYLTVKGQVLHYLTKEAEPDVNLVLKEGDRVLDSARLDSNGSYELKLPYDAVLSIWIDSEEHHDGFISFNTNIPLANRKQGLYAEKNIPVYPKDIDHINPKAFELPVSKMIFSEDNGAFLEDQDMKSQFETALTDVPQVVNTDTLPEVGGRILVSGVIRNLDGNRLSSAEAQVIKNGTVSSVSTADKRGKYEIIAPLNEVFSLRFKSDGHHTMQMDVDSRVPEDEELSSDDYTVDLPIDMYKESTKINSNVAKKPFAKLFFSEEYKQFVWDDNVSSYYFANIESKEKETTVDTTELNVEAPKLFTKAQLKGSIVDESGNPSPGTSVQLVSSTGEVIQESITDDKGNYELDNIELKKDYQIILKKDGIYQSTAKLESKGGTSRKERVALPALKTYSKSNPAHNPTAFNLPMQGLIVEGNGNVSKDPSVSNAFTQQLNKPRTDTRLVLVGQIENLDQEGVSQADVKVVIKKNDSIIATTTSDGKGGYRVSIPYGEEYTVSIQKEGFHDVSYDVDTRLPKGVYRTNRTMQPTNVKMASVEDEDINVRGTQKRYNRIAFNGSKDTFDNSRSVHSSYLATLYKDEEPDPIAQQDTTRKSDFDYEVEKVKVKPYEEQVREGMAILNKREKQYENELRRNRAIKQQTFNNLRSAVFASDTSNIPNDKDVAFNMQSIRSISETIIPNAQKTVDNHIEEKVESMNRMNNVVAMALLALRRGGISDTISWDSVFQVSVPVRVYETTITNGVYSFKQSKVTHKSTMDIYSEQTSWWIFSTYYKNGAVIDDDEYENELASYKARAEAIIET